MFFIATQFLKDDYKQTNQNDFDTRLPSKSLHVLPQPWGGYLHFSLQLTKTEVILRITLKYLVWGKREASC